jgi:25S rRNA (uracil2634-N3)-methyltransferase
MGKLKRKKLVNALGRILKKQDKKLVQERKLKAHDDNLEKAKRNQVKPKNVAKAVASNRARPQYSSKDTILLVGEGNFSFAKSLCENYLEEGADNLTATCFDTEEVLYKKYEEAEENVELVRSFGGTVLFEVDGTDLPKEVKKNKYTKIIFNFPHIGKSVLVWQISVLNICVI